MEAVSVLRKSSSQMFSWHVFLKITIFTEKTPMLESLWSAVLKAAAFSNFIKKMTPTLAFFCEYCEIFKNVVSTEHSFPVAASAPIKNS